MSIQYRKDRKIFKLDTENTTYMIGISPEGYLGHIYYGGRLEEAEGAYLMRMEEPPFTPSVNPAEEGSFMDVFPMEYPVGGMGDFRESCLDIRDENGATGCECFYDSYEVIKGKPELAGLPATFGKEDEVETLQITCKDSLLNMKVILSYSVFAKEDVITRSVKVVNDGTGRIRIGKILSACLDMDNEEFEMLSLCGAWAREREIQRVPVSRGTQTVSSRRGESGHQQNPFIALVTSHTTQTQGKVYAMNFVYSGNFIGQAERTAFNGVRMVMGINGEEFCWNLRSGESFQAPEVVMTYSDAGLGKMTRSFHDLYRNHLIRSKYKDQQRPILINNWEATYFDFDTDKLLAIAREAKKDGIEMLVMDDGWFGNRNEPAGSLGDWVVNEKKIKGGLKYLVDEVNKIGLKFGIWFEPEMISEDSDLYRTHPDWAIQLKGRKPANIRSQYVLDLSNPEVVDYVFEAIAKVLRSANIAYVKWDMNRPLCDLGSNYLDKDSQQELMHRYVLGLYELQERLVTEFPDLLLENCSSGGARFDPGMLYYSPQIWCSDDQDVLERLKIQEGTALVYPLSTIGAHVSDCPNHSVGRTTPFETRGYVALAGTFGYELDITKISEEDRKQVPKQCADYHKYNDLVREGDYYRLASFSENGYYDAYMVVRKDKKEALMTYVQAIGIPNSHSRKIYLQGLDPKKTYRLEGTEETYSGAILMKGGFLLKDFWGDAVGRLYHFVMV